MGPRRIPTREQEEGAGGFEQIEFSAMTEVILSISIC